MRETTIGLMVGGVLLLGACSREPRDPRGVGHDEVLVQVTASGQAETAPNEARFSAGVSSIGATADAATAANNTIMNKVVSALEGFGVAKADIQTQRLTVSRIEWGANKNKFEANNVVSVRMRAIDKAGPAIAAVTQAGANVLSGPDLRVGDPEAASRSAYASAYKAARARADTYAEAAGLKVSRVLTIRDGGASPVPMAYESMGMMDRAAPQALAAPPVMAGTNTSQVSVSVDFALARK
ncbi:SIMPL domain-containing protein [Sphingomonas sp. ZT3P38]|uniref:SIMPL domain-containing protein n=1 Tax=Parasphingomonas zepuensis TaxID=3096161 RepID=UPI002FC7C587